MKPRACPDCGSLRSLSATGFAQDLRCLDCDALLFGDPAFYKYLGGLFIIVVLVLAAVWIVLGW
jgi:hypothetical protein